MFKNPKTYIVILCILIAITGVALLSAKHQEINVAETVIAPAKVVTLTFKHPYWTDEMILEGENRIHRKSSPKETATIKEKTPNTFTLVWDKWGTETYIKQADGSYTLQK